MPAKVIVFCPMLEFKNKPATLMTISPHGYYECRVDMAAGNHTVYLPIAGHGDHLHRSPTSSARSRPTSSGTGSGRTASGRAAPSAGRRMTLRSAAALLLEFAYAGCAASSAPSGPSA